MCGDGEGGEGGSGKISTKISAFPFVFLFASWTQTSKLNNAIRLSSVILPIGKIFPFKTWNIRTSKMSFMLPFGNFRGRDLSFPCITWECPFAS